MLPALARRTIQSYSEPGDLVVDPMCGIGTTLVEAIHLDRRAVGVELEARWTKLARANIGHAREQGAGGTAQVLRGDAGQLPRLLTNAPDLLLTSPPYGNAVPAEWHGAAAGNVAALPYGRVDLVLSSPPYVCEVGELDKRAWGTGGDLCPTEKRNYSADHRNLGHARGRTYLGAMAAIYRACASVLKPGGFLVLVTKNMRSGGALRNLAGDTTALCEDAGLLYWQHVIALLATIRDGELVPRPSFWQRMQVKRALARGDRVHLVCHEDVLVFRKPAFDEAEPCEPRCSSESPQPTEATAA